MKEDGEKKDEKKKDGSRKVEVVGVWEGKV